MTRAAGLPELSPGTIKARLKVIRAVSERSIRSSRRDMVGRTVKVLIEKADSTGGIGVDEYYNRVTVSSPGLVPGEICRVKVDFAGRDGCVGAPVP